MVRRLTVSQPMVEQTSLPPVTAIYTAFLCVLFGANAVAIKISLVGLGIYTTAALRFSIATLVIWAWAFSTQKPLKITAIQFLKLVPSGVIFFCQLALFYTGLSKTTASHGTLISNALPFIIMVLAHFFIPGETITWKKTTGLLIGFIGVVVLFSDKVTLTGHGLEGDMIVLAAVLFWGCNAVYVKRIIHDFHPVQITLYPMAIALPLLIIGSLFVDNERVRFLNPDIISAMVYQALVTASFAFIAWNTLVKRYGTTLLHSFVFIMPLSGVFFGVLLLNEPLTANLMVSIALVTTGLIVVNKNGIKRPVEQPAKQEG
ncbi:permease of the drug/metabolite transporter (DMT) family [Desulforapulum autotrophicum HRM2]|uniref:Permease of the drug/metabolite transporter (DMT) family n=1 Tax=Desulforapulum autotrophicum (strain ATCC 43914 / DSM 3382 / VKM B-1955 / HRM2) TaxID=177437 RepID=C0QCQ6_DESAH|nr:DMT family transporter [Desulforapulum autotrophicum]ACN15133.1 permease of the drug/metabolite transporter (DMT) family [Desulforapulum autotrophicum HRM2]